MASNTVMNKQLYHHIQWNFLINDILTNSFQMRPLTEWTKRIKWGEDLSRVFTIPIGNNQYASAPSFADSIYFSSWSKKAEHVRMWETFSHSNDVDWMSCQHNIEIEENDIVGDYSGVRIGVDEKKLKYVLEAKVMHLYSMCRDKQLHDYEGIYAMNKIKYMDFRHLMEHIKKFIDEFDVCRVWADPKQLLNNDIMNLPREYAYQGEVRLYIYFDKISNLAGLIVPVGVFKDFVDSICFDPRLSQTIKEKRIDILKSFGIPESKFVDSKISLSAFIDRLKAGTYNPNTSC